MKRLAVAMVVCLFIVMFAGVGVVQAIDIWPPAEVFGIPNSQMWFFNHADWGGSPGEHAIAVVDFDYGVLYGSQLDGNGNPMALYFYDLVSDRLFIDAGTGWVEY